MLLLAPSLLWLVAMQWNARLRSVVVVLGLGLASLSSGYGLGRVQRVNFELVRSRWRSEPMPAACPFLRRALRDPEALRGKAGWAPGARGIALLAVRAGSTLGRLGLRTGDVVTRVNGLAMTRPDNGIALYAALRTADLLTLDVERHGRAVRLSCRLE